MSQIRFKDKSGKTKYIATEQGKILEVGKGGKIKEVGQAKESKKEETIKIIPADFKE